MSLEHAPNRHAIPARHKVAYRIPEWCEATGLSRSFIYDAIKAGMLRITKVGRTSLIMAEDGLDWLERHRERMSERER